MPGRPQLTFAVELESPQFVALLSNPTVLEQLQALQARLSVGLLDRTPERAAVLRKLHQAGIPLVAWLLLDKRDGYWFHLDNVEAATSTFRDWETWTRAENLHWEAVAFDFEVDIREVPRWFHARLGLMPTLLWRLISRKRLYEGTGAYRTLAALARASGWKVETYQFPLIADDRRVGSNYLQRLLGIVDLSADRETLMLYSSLSEKFGEGILWSYAQDTRSVGVGITGGGVSIPGMAPFPQLSYGALARNLRMAARWVDDIFIFSLEGCVENGYLEKLVHFNWEKPCGEPTDETTFVNRLRLVLAALLGMGRAAFPILIALLVYGCMR